MSRQFSGVLARASLVLALAFCFFAPHARADIFVNVGVLSYDTFIPAANGSPGIDAFDISNFTGAFSLPNDFPVTDSVTFTSASLTLTQSNRSVTVIPLGNIGPGFLLDQNGNPIVQVPGNESFSSVEFTATLSRLSFLLANGATFTANSSSIDIVLTPSIGTTLSADIDSSLIQVSGTATVITPEPANGKLVLLPALLLLAWLAQRSRRSQYKAI
jgi:hypothetical protein